MTFTKELVRAQTVGTDTVVGFWFLKFTAVVEYVNPTSNKHS